MCVKCVNNTCIGGYNCKLGSCVEKYCICVNDLNTGICKIPNCRLIHLSKRGLKPYYRYKDKKSFKNDKNYKNIDNFDESKILDIFNIDDISDISDKRLRYELRVSRSSWERVSLNLR